MKISALLLSVALAVTPVAARAQTTVSVDVEWSLVVPVNVVLGSAAVIDLFMLGTAIASRRSAHIAWELVGLGIGAVGVGVGSLYLVEYSGSADARSVAISTIGGGGLLIGAAIWSIALPSRGGYTLVPWTDGETTGLVVGGRF